MTAGSSPSRDRAATGRRAGVFDRFASQMSAWLGRPGAFAAATIAIVVWAVAGPVFHFSDTWQLVVNTATTVLTFLMVFLVQNTINRDSKALHLKLDELIRVNALARDALLDAEDRSEHDLQRLVEQERNAAESSGG